MHTESPLAISQGFAVPNFGRDSRRLFFTDPDFTNLNHGSFGTIPEPIQRACEILTKQCEANPDVFIRRDLFNRISVARQAISKLIGVDANTCVFVNNVATAINTVLQNFKWGPEDYIIHTDAVFVSVSLAIQNIPHTHAPKISVLNIDGCLSSASILKRFQELIYNIRKEIRSRSSDPTFSSDNPPKIVFVMETITANPSLLLPWRDMVRICREENVWSVVDAAHSLGQESEINLTEVDPDFWMTNCSKWYYAQRGCAILYVPLRNQDMIKIQLVPGVTHPVRGPPPSDFVHKFFWTGMTDPVPILSIEFAIAFRQRLGGEKKINDYCHSLAVTGGRLVAEILGTTVLDVTKEGELTANMTNIGLPIPSSTKPSNEIFFMFEDEMMDVHRIFVVPFYYQGQWWARASAQIYNDLSDFERLGRALAEICQKINQLATSASKRMAQMSVSDPETGTRS